MKKIHLTIVSLLLAGCASIPTNDPISAVEVNYLFEKFKAQDGQITDPLRGKYKEVSFLKTSGLGNPTFSCSGTDTMKKSKYLNIHTDTSGSAKLNLAGVDCGEAYGPYSTTGFQTLDKLYLREPNGRTITVFRIDSISGKLIRHGYYRSRDGSIKFFDAYKNNETWKEEGFSKNSYKSTGYVPQRNWSEVDNFEQIEGQNASSNSSGFNFGKALALGAGAMIGGGSSLSADQQALILGGIIADSMEGVDGVSNMESATSSIVTNAQKESSGYNLSNLNQETSTEAISNTSTKSNYETKNSSVSAGGGFRDSCDFYEAEKVQEEKWKAKVIQINQSYKNIPYSRETWRARNDELSQAELTFRKWVDDQYRACGINVDATPGSTRE